MPDAPTPPQQADRLLAAPPAGASETPAKPARRPWLSAIGFVAVLWNEPAKVIGVGALALIGLLLYEAFQVTTAIEPIAVPKVLADAGYTPEVAALRLRDALTQFAADAEKELKSSTFSLRAELANIVVPTVGLSADTITSTILRVTKSSRRRTITGEFTLANDLLWLRLRVDGQPRYTSDKGVDREKPNELLADAAPAIFDTIEPYYFAASFRYKDPPKALEIADEIIGRWPDTDKRAAPLYDLKGSIYLDLNQPAKAAAELEKAIQLNPSLQYAHRDLGHALLNQGKDLDAIVAYSEAVRRNDVPAYLGLGDVYRIKQRYDEARAFYRQAIELAPKFVVADNKIVAEVKVLAYTGLGDIFLNEKEYDKARASYLEAARLAPKSGIADAEATAHNGLGTSFYRQNNYKAALAPYREASRLKPDDPTMRTNLGETFLALGMKEAAIAEFSKALSLDQNNETARQGLDKAMK